MLAHMTGADWLGAGLVGFVAGTAALATGHALFALARSPLGRLLVGLVYAVPAAAVGYGVAYGVVAVGAPNPAWHMVLAMIGAGGVGAVAFQRMSALAPPAEPELARGDGQIDPALDPAHVHPR